MAAEKRRWRLTSLGFAAVVLIAGCSSGPGAEGESTIDTARIDRDVPIGEASEVADPNVEAAPPPPEGTVVWVEGLEPADLHYDQISNGLPVAGWIQTGLLESLFGVDRNLDYYPQLLDGEPALTVRSDDTVEIKYQLRSDLRWSDDTPLTAEDVAYTHRILTEGCAEEADGSIADGTNDGCRYDMNSRFGLDLVTGFEVTGEVTFTVTLANFFADWRRLYRTVFAAHAFGDDAAEVNRRLLEMTGPDGALPSSGPLQFESWERGQSLTLARNDRYHGSADPLATNDGVSEVDAVRIDFVPDRQARIDAVAAGRADLLFERPTPDHSPLVDDEGFVVAPIIGAEYEHWGLNLLNPHLADPAVREAMALAIDKDPIVDQVYGETRAADDQPVPLGNTYWLSKQANYVDNQADFAGAQPAQAAAALEAAGYTRNSDGVFRHPTRGPLSIRIGTTGGDDRRELVQTLLAEQLTEAGFEIVVDNVAGGAYFRERPFSDAAIAASTSGGTNGDGGLWDVAQFAWSGGPWPGGQSGAYRSGADGNPYGFSNPEFDIQANDCDATPDDGERADCYNELDQWVTTLEGGEDGLFMIPLVETPLLYGFGTARVASIGVTNDSDRGGPLASIVDLRLADASS